MRTLAVLVVVGALAATGCRLLQGSGAWPQKPAFELKDSGQNFVMLAFSPDSKMLASAELQNPSIVLWNTASDAAPRQARRLQPCAPDALAFSPDSRLLAAACDDKTIKIWEIATGAVKQSFAGHGGIAFSPDGRLLAFGAYDKSLGLWDVQGGGIARAIAKSEGEGQFIAFSPNGQVLALGNDRAITLRDVASGNILRTLTGHSEALWGLAFSPDGRVLASGSHDQTIRLWDAGSGAMLRTLSEPFPAAAREPVRAEVASLAFSPDSQRLAAGSDNTVRIWDAATGADAGVHTATKQEGMTPGRVAFSADGRYLAAGLYGRIDVWRMTGDGKPH
jgi:WD40 repeat protein